MPPQISLLVATIHRTAELDRLLSSLRAQSYPHFQVYLADQNPQGFLDAVVQAHSPHLSITRLSLPPCGVSAARNALLPLATGDIIAFPDDDCWYEPETLAAVVDFFGAHPAWGGILASWVESGKKSPPVRGFAALTPYGAIGGSETYVQFYRRAVVRAVGDFDPNLGPGTGLPWGCGEDSDYVLRAIAHADLCRVPAVRVHHPLPVLIARPDAPLAVPLSAPVRAKYHAYALGRMYLLKKHAFPFWFRLLNVLYPLLLLPLETVRHGRVAAQYRWAMFMGRLRGLWL